MAGVTDVILPALDEADAPRDRRCGPYCLRFHAGRVPRARGVQTTEFDSAAAHSAETATRADTLSLHHALPLSARRRDHDGPSRSHVDRFGDRYLTLHNPRVRLAARNVAEVV